MYSLLSSFVTSDLNPPMNPLSALHPPLKISHKQDVMLFRVRSFVLPHVDTLNTCGHPAMDDRLVIRANDVYPKFLRKHV